MDLAASMTPASMAASLLVSMVGFVLFHYGRKQTRFPQLVTGLLLLVEPLFVAQALPMLGVGGVLIGAMWLVLRAGV